MNWLNEALEVATGMSQQLVSYHVRELRQAEVIAATAEGRSNRYRLCCSDLHDLVSLLNGLEAAAQPLAPTSGGS